MATLDILIPHYNDSEALDLTLRSIAAQTWDGTTRVVIVDDGSRPEEANAARAVAEAFVHPVTFIANPRNRGRPYSRNVLLDSIDAPFVAWLDAGDDWYPYVTWTLGVPRAAFAAAPIDDGVLVFGGYSIFGPEPDVEFYVPNEGGDERAPLPEPRGGLAGVAGNGRVYAIGGENAAGQAVARVDVYDPVADAWQAGTPLPAGRKGAVAAEVNGTLYVFGGRTDGGALATTSLSMALGTATGPAVPAAAFDLVLDGPNPLRDRARLTLALDRPMTAQVAVYDALGRRVALLHDGPLGAGQHALVWEAAGLPAGAYLVRATAGGERVVQRLTVVR